MQTFVPYTSFKKSLRCLDKQRLGKQRVEAWQIYRALTVPGHGYWNHAATRMWRGYIDALLYYMKYACEEFAKRGGRNILMQPRLEWATEYLKGRPLIKPFWVGDERVHSSHRSNLLRKDAVYFGKYGWTEPPTMDYYWPVPNTNTKSKR